MKIKVFLWTVVILCLSLLAVGCSGECTEHTDENKDGKCDKCEAAVACATHTDADGDWVCDICGGAVTPTIPVCDLHTDSDSNLICDVCGVTVPPVCDPHKDTNADNLCDVCGGAIVVITEQIAPKSENRVNMVVNTAPADAVLSQYLQTTPEQKLPSSVSSADYEGVYDRYLYGKTAEGTYTKHEVRDLVTGSVIYSETVETARSVEVTLFSAYVRATVVGDNGAYEVTYVSYGGKVLFAESVAAGDTGTAVTVDEAYSGRYVRLDIGDRKCFVIDPSTREILVETDDPRSLVARPVFSVETETYGYRQEGSMLYIYDLSRWVECVMSYRIPGYYEDASWFVLQNGSVLLQAFVTLADDAVSYDLLANGDKLDMVNLLIDPTAGESAEIEFGYVIRYVEADPADGFTAAALNLVEVWPIRSDRADSSAAKWLITDNTMKVLYDLDNAFGGRSASLLADGLFLVADSVLGVYEVMDIDGNRVSVIPWEVDGFFDTFYEVSGVYYNLRGEVILDEADGFVRVIDGGFIQPSGYALFVKTDSESLEETYYLCTGEGLTRLDVTDVTDAYFAEFGFVLSHTVEGATVHTLYDVAGNKVGDLAGSPISPYADEVAEDVYTFICYDAASMEYFYCLLDYRK